MKSGSKPVFPFPPTIAEGGLRILLGKATGTEIMAVQAKETHNTNKLGKKDILNLKSPLFLL